LRGRDGRIQETKREYFKRYFADEALNEDWVTAESRRVQLGAPLRPHAALSDPRARFTALDSDQPAHLLPRLMAHVVSRGADERRVAAWPSIGFIREHPDLPHDIREKILQAEDELTRTVRIRGATRQ
jgi:aminopeptidase N